MSYHIGNGDGISPATKRSKNMNENANIFQLALSVVTNDDKRLDRLAKPMASQFTLDGRVIPFQEAYDDAVASYATAKGNKTQQARISRAWALASKRIYYHLGEVGWRFSAPSLRSGGDVSIMTITEARRENAAQTQAKADKIKAAIASASARSEAVKHDKMLNATPESIASDLAEILCISGVSLASVARALYHGEAWDLFVRDVNQLASAPLIQCEILVEPAEV